MNILYQYYNEIVLNFADYLVDFQNKVIVIQVPDDNKPFDMVCQKIKIQLERISQTLDTRDCDINICIERSGQKLDLILQKV